MAAHRQTNELHRELQRNCIGNCIENGQRNCIRSGSKAERLYLIFVIRSTWREAMKRVREEGSLDASDKKLIIEGYWGISGLKLILRNHRVLRNRRCQQLFVAQTTAKPFGRLWRLLGWIGAFKVDRYSPGKRLQTTNVMHSGSSLTTGSRAVFEPGFERLYPRSNVLEIQSIRSTELEILSRLTSRSTVIDPLLCYRRIRRCDYRLIGDISLMFLTSSQTHSPPFNRFRKF